MWRVEGTELFAKITNQRRHTGSAGYRRAYRFYNRLLELAALCGFYEAFTWIEQLDDLYPGARHLPWIE